MFCYALNIQPGLTHTFLLYFKPVTGNLNTYKLMLQAFFLNNTFISKVRMKLAENHANGINILKLNFSYLKIIHILYIRYDPK